MDNYTISRDRAQAYFLNFDQAVCIARWDLAHDERWLYAAFLGRPYRICRATGAVYRCEDGREAGFSEVLSIFDFLCHDSPVRQLTGVWAPVNSLKGLTATAGVATDFHSATAAFFDRDEEAFRAACRSLGATEVAMGDIGFCFPIFGDFRAILKFYRSDEEFPASATLLWDENALQFIYYETVFYVAGYLLQAIRETMQQAMEKKEALPC